MVLPLTAIICQICYQPVRCHQKFKTAHGRSGHGECVDKVPISGIVEPMTAHLLIYRFLETLDDSCVTKKTIRDLLVIVNHVLGKQGGNRLQTSISLENNSKVKQLESTIKVLENNVCMANNENNLCQTKLQDINMQVVDLESRIDELKNSHADDQSLIHTIVADKALYQNHLNAAKTRIRELEGITDKCKCARGLSVNVVKSSSKLDNTIDEHPETSGSRNFKSEGDGLKCSVEQITVAEKKLWAEVHRLETQLRASKTTQNMVAQREVQALKNALGQYAEKEIAAAAERSQAQTHLHTATNRIGELTTELAILECKCGRLSEIAKSFEDERDEMMKDQQLSNEKISVLNNEIRSLRDSMEFAATDTKAISAERDQLRRECQVFTEHQAEAASENSTSAADRDLARSQLQAATNRIIELTTELAKRQREHLALEKVAKTFRTNRDELLKAQELSNENINGFNNEIKNLRDSMESATTNANVISSERDQLLQERQVLTERLAQAASENNTSVADRDLARSQLQRTTIDIDKLTAELAIAEIKCGRLREIAKKYRDENVDVRKDNELSHRKINGLNNEIKNLRELVKMERNQLLIERQVFPKRQAKLVSENAKMKDALDQSIKEVSNLQLYIDVELRSCVERANEFAAEVEELKLTKEQSLSEIKELSAKRDCLINTLEIANRRVTKLESEIEECRRSHRNAIDEVKVISAERDKTADDLYTSAQKVRELAEELDSLNVVNVVSETIEMLQRAIEETEADEKGHVHLNPTTKVNAPAEEGSSDKKSTWIDIELEGFDTKVTRLRSHLQYCYEMIFTLQTTCPRLSTLDAVRRNKTDTDVILVAVDSVNQMLNKTVDAGVSELVACDDCAPKPAKVARYE